MNIFRCQVRISTVVQVDLSAETVSDQPTGRLAELVARQQHGYNYSAETLSIEAAYVETDGLCASCGGAKWTHSVRDHAWVAPAIAPAPHAEGTGA